MPGFLIEYNRETGRALVTEYDSSAAALRERVRLDLETTRPEVEHVVLMANSLADIRKTHSRYFMRHEPETRKAA